jgi:hypothetical protein
LCVSAAPRSPPASRRDRRQNGAAKDFCVDAAAQQKSATAQKCPWNLHFFDVSCCDAASRTRASLRTRARDFGRDGAAAAEFTTLKKFCGGGLPRAC